MSSVLGCWLYCCTHACDPCFRVSCLLAHLSLSGLCYGILNNKKGMLSPCLLYPVPLNCCCTHKTESCYTCFCSGHTHVSACIIHTFLLASYMHQRAVMGVSVGGSLCPIYSSSCPALSLTSITLLSMYRYLFGSLASLN